MAESHRDDYVSRELFGGAMTVDMPVGFEDVSNLRPVPSHQEIYLSSTGFTSVAIDITERVTAAESDRDALIFHFDDIVNTYDKGHIWAIMEGVHISEHFPSSTPILTLKGTINNSANSTPSELSTTAIFLALIRLGDQATDLIVTVNIPLHDKAAEAYSEGVVHDDRALAIANYEWINEGKDSSSDGLEGGFEKGSVKAGLVYQGECIAQRVLKSLRINDWGLFGGGMSEGRERDGEGGSMSEEMK